MDAFDERAGPNKFNEGRKPTSLHKIHGASK